MPRMTRDPQETSVAFSLIELAKLEETRVREEEERRARAREAEAREQAAAEARRRAAEEARLAAEEEARARRMREEAEQQMRAKAREQAALEVARIEAEAKARLDEENARRAHELAVLRVRTQSVRRRLQIALAAVLGLGVCGGSAAAVGVHREVASLERDNQELRDGQSALSRERDRARMTELAQLDRRFAALDAHPLAAAEQARATAIAARNAVDAKALDHNRLRAFADALDALQARIEGLEKLAALDRRHSDLLAWAEQARHKSDAVAAARTAAARAKPAADEGALRAYEAAIDKLRDALAKGALGRGQALPRQSNQGRCTDPNDPMCGFDGQSL